MTAKMCDCNQGRLPCHMQCRDKPQATKIINHEDGRHGDHHEFLRQIMRKNSPSGPVHMDSMMGKNFTTWFLIKCGMFGVAAAYVFDWVIMSMPV